MSPELNLAFSFAKELATQLITLATAVIGFTVTFSKELFFPAKWWKVLVVLSWVLFLASILGGVWTLMALTGSLAADERPTNFGFNVLFPAGLQIFLFGIGLLTMIILGAVSIWKRNQP